MNYDHGSIEYDYFSRFLCISPNPHYVVPEPCMKTWTESLIAAVNAGIPVPVEAPVRFPFADLKPVAFRLDYGMARRILNLPLWGDITFFFKKYHELVCVEDNRDETIRIITELASWETL